MDLFGATLEVMSACRFIDESCGLASLTRQLMSIIVCGAKPVYRCLKRKLSCCRETARHAAAVKILSAAALAVQKISFKKLTVDEPP